MKVGPVSGSCPTGQAPSGLVGSRCDPGYEEWRDALAAFYRHDERPRRALEIQQGAPFQFLDCETIKALQAAFATRRDAA